MRVVIQIMQKQKRGNMGLEAVKLVPGPAAVCRIKQLPEITVQRMKGKNLPEKTGKQGQKSEKLKFTYKEEREYAVIDEDIARLEEKIARLENDMMANATNSVKLREIMADKEAAEKQLEEKMDRWVYLNDLAERIEAQKNNG